MPRLTNALTAAKVRTASAGRYGDGGGLYLLVRDGGLRSWVFRYTMPSHKMREMGLGRAGASSGSVPLAEAREKAAVLSKLVRAGIDPLARRDADERAARAARQNAASRAVTFQEAAERYIAANEAGWRNPKHAQQWANTLKTYAYPHFGDIPVSEIATGHVMAALGPIWTVKAETASRLRGRVEAILDFAKSRGWRHGDNPAAWKGNIAHNLPKRSKIASVVHHPALPWQDVPAFMVLLKQQKGIGARALEFTIYTAGRSGETLGARWSEMDTDNALWTIPASRMKAKKEHAVPLSGPAIAALKQMAAWRPTTDPDEFVFPGARHGHPLSNMSMTEVMRRMQARAVPHGFRSSFRDFAAESTSHPHEVAEAALAHVVKTAVEAAYRRGDLLEKRRGLMNDWAEFCDRPAPVGDNVHAIRGASNGRP